MAKKSDFAGIPGLIITATYVALLKREKLRPRGRGGWSKGDMKIPK